MKKIFLVPSLRQYLKDRGVLEQFNRNVITQRGFIIEPIDLQTAFDWSITPEGVAFWCAISDEYDSMIVASTVRKVSRELYYGDDDSRPD